MADLVAAGPRDDDDALAVNPEVFADQGEEAATLRAEIDLASGRTVSSRNALIITATGTHAPGERLARRGREWLR